jgi:hypothetical protein
VPKSTPEFAPQPGAIVAQEHWCSSGFANTDLDLQLKKHGIHRLIVTGLLAHTCVESTVRFAAELGYDVTMVKDATASFTDEQVHAALRINIPNYASAMVTQMKSRSFRRSSVRSAALQANLSRSIYGFTLPIARPRTLVRRLSKRRLVSVWSNPESSEDVLSRGSLVTWTR